ncbi:MAG: extracellular solute-binding protein [Clostridia bacterium]
MLRKLVSLSLAVLMLLGSASALAETAELEFFCTKGEVVTVMEEIIKDFTAENPDVKISLTSVADAETVLLTRVATNDMPDISIIWPAEITYKNLFTEGYIIDMTDKEFLKNVNPKLLSLTEYNGKQFCLPMTLSSYGIYYRKDIFNKLGLVEPQTYDELIAVCKTLSENGYDAFALPNKDVGNVAQRFERMMGVMNPTVYKDFEAIAAGEMKIEDCKAIPAFAQLCLDILPYSTKDSMGLDYESAMADLVNGKAAMMFSGTWMLSSMQASNPDIDVELMAVPSPLYEGLLVPVNVDTSFAVSTTCKYPEAALAFVEYLSRTEVAQKYYAVDGNVNMINGVVFDKPQHMDMKNMMDEGKMFLTMVNFWPAGFREGMRAFAHALFLDGDVDAFEQAVSDAIAEYYVK